MFSFSIQFHSHFLRSQWKFRDQRELPPSLRYQGELRGQVMWSGGPGVEGLELGTLKLSSSRCLAPSGRMLPQPLEQQQRRPCPEVHLLLLRVVAPVTNTMELQLRLNLGRLQSPQ